MSHEGSAAVAGPRWKVLLVDDEPAVHEVSRLILADCVFDGRELEILSAASAAQAREVLARHDDVALVLLDVVMETDDAGMALVQHIRGALRNADVQIVLRTGQPGMAPERDVVLRYEINGYCLKTDLTAQRLQSIVVAALRGYRATRSLRSQLARDGRHSVPAAADAQRGALADELECAHDTGAVLLHAQPEVMLASHQVCGVEIVPQWKTSLGLLTAARVRDALPAGPARGRVARWLLAQACFWARSWSAAGERGLTVSVPLVADSLGDCDTLEAVLAAVREARLAPRALDLLVGEQALLGGGHDMRAAVAALRALGVTFTLVDFGAQTIALQQLNQIVPDRLKMHRLFVRDVAADPELMAVARSLMALAQTLNVVAIADGLASDRDAQFFKWEGCEVGQGDALAPACALSDVAAYLQDGRRPSH